MTRFFTKLQCSRWKLRWDTIIEKPAQGQIQWLLPVILATLDTEIRRSQLKASPGERIIKTPSQPI
jgi:hypothetical protein